MRRVIVMAIAAGGLLTATAVLAEESPAPAAPTADQASPAAAPAVAQTSVDPKSDPNRMICTRERVTGSNRPEKVCLTAGQRERLRELERRSKENSRSDKSQSGAGGG